MGKSMLYYPSTHLEGLGAKLHSAASPSLVPGTNTWYTLYETLRMLSWETVPSPVHSHFCNKVIMTVKCSVTTVRISENQYSLFDRLCNWESRSPKPHFTLTHYSTTPIKVPEPSELPSSGKQCVPATRLLFRKVQATRVTPLPSPT